MNHSEAMQMNMDRKNDMCMMMCCMSECVKNR
jgi:hypothetical protein